MKYLNMTLLKRDIARFCASTRLACDCKHLDLVNERMNGIVGRGLVSIRCVPPQNVTRQNCLLAPSTRSERFHCFVLMSTRAVCLVQFFHMFRWFCMRIAMVLVGAGFFLSASTGWLDCENNVLRISSCCCLK